MKMSDNMNEDQNMEFRYKFLKYSINDSHIRIREFFQLSKEMNLPLTDLEFKYYKSKLDVDCDSLLTYQQFLFWAFRKQIDPDTEQEIQNLFKMIDTKGRGLIGAQDLHRFLSGLPYHRGVEYSEVDQILYTSDMDKDGFLNYEEFVRLVLPDL